MTHILITGTNRGLGLEFVKQYVLDANNRIFACCRNPKEAKELQTLVKDHPKQISLHACDVHDHKQIEALAKDLQKIPIDILLNNAGVYKDKPDSLGKINYEDWMLSFRVNTMAPLKMTEAFLPHLMAGKRKLIAIVTSQMGSIAENEKGGHYLYRSSKTAANMVGKCLAKDLREKGITVLLLHPGWVVTDMGGPNAAIQPTESILGLRKVIDSASLEKSGKFYSYQGTELPW